MSLAQTAPTIPANLQPQAAPLKKGDPAPFDGVELTTDAANKNQVKLQQGALAQQQVNVLNQVNAAKDIQIKDLTNAYDFTAKQRDLFNTQAQQEYEQLQKEHKDNTLNTVLLFGGGAVTVLILDFIVRSATKNN